ncbi:glycoside hydrolase family 5 [Apiospora rasikravindrae]|uniref:glucan endo-1,6-beta-glucosidase n=1 Tax=Apiospora rasikravindrae TaxID=990691 RepID=A0ABR1SRE6_9PEZI
MLRVTLASILLACAVDAWLPQDRSDLAAFNQSRHAGDLETRFKPHLPNGVTKIRGVNFGGWLVSEPWMMRDEWRSMGCTLDSDVSEFDCMRNHYTGNNRAAGNQAFQKHWREWINAATVQSVHDVGLNTIRIPIGYWSYNDIVDKASEPFADGNAMLPYLDAVVQKATDLGMYVIIDLHGAPGGQQQDVFTGQNPNPAGFFNDYNFDRACKWLSWMTKRIHSNPAYASVGMIEVLNEPVSKHDAGGRYPAPGEVPGLVEKYYPRALKAVRDAESNVPDDRKLHVQFMSAKWDAGNPRTGSSVANGFATAFDDHNYIGFALQNTGDQYKLMHLACTDSRLVDGEDFRITGEWSMTSGADWHDAAFFKKFFTAQQQLYEKPGMNGWIFWTWKTELNDPRWTYSYATYLNYIPTTAAGLENNVYQDVCAGYR